jgi:single-stranded-DNA-specific exonuclease
MNNRMIAREPVECDTALVEEIERSENVTALTARALVRRGVSSTEQAKLFLHPSELMLYDAFLLPDMGKAVERIRRAIERQESICVYGDYDADGVCATAILTGRLRQMGARAGYYIPLRHSEGYGLSEQSVRKLKERGTELIVTVDNGVSAFDEIALCSALGIDVIVTDHHSVGKSIPECIAVVAASRKDSAYPNRYLCGAGVALKLIQALNDDAYSDAELAMAAVATIADVVPLTEENRILAACGLKYVDTVPGFAALLNAAAWKQARVDAQTVSFVIAPRLNAAGRMSTASAGVELLLGADEKQTREIAAQLNADNQARKDTENTILEEAKRQILEQGQAGHALILSHTDWNPGVIGIVASRLCEAYHIPVLLFAEKDGVLTGSGRSIEGVDLFENLSVFSDLFLRFGGHARAAGVTIRAEEFSRFKTAFMAHIEVKYKPEDFFPSFAYDETAALCEMTVEQIRELRLLAPFGEGNPEPAFRYDNVRFSQLRTIGKDDKHLCSSVVQGDQIMRVVAFGKSDLMEALQGASDWDLVARPAINRFRGMENVELFWVCANASEEKYHIFNAFFEQSLYNESCSDDKLTEWYFSSGGLEGSEADREAMRRYYRKLAERMSGGAQPLRLLIRELKSEELIALCVFAQLSFFIFDPKAKSVAIQANAKQHSLDESSLYRIIRRKQEA